MKFSYDDALKYIAMPKKILSKDQTRLDIFSYTGNSQDKRLSLVSDSDVVFLLVFNRSLKNRLKLTLHLQDEDSSLGLLRVDFNGRHKNPSELNRHVPNFFHPYRDAFIEESHIHYHVDGYPMLAWAVPLMVDASFSQKKFEIESDFEGVCRSFFQKITLETKVNFLIQEAFA